MAGVSAVALVTARERLELAMLVALAMGVLGVAVSDAQQSSHWGWMWLFGAEALVLMVLYADTVCRWH